jgi:hypothetical protein
MANKLFVRKSIEKIMGQAEATGEHQFKRTLGVGHLVLLGIGAIIGAGLFVRTAAAAAEHAGSCSLISTKPKSPGDWRGLFDCQTMPGFLRGDQSKPTRPICPPL